MAYDASTDSLYVFSGKCCDTSVLPTAFRLSRVSGHFQLDSYQPLPTGSDFTAAAWSPTDHKVYVGVRKELRTYDFVTNVVGPIFRVPNLTGILGLASHRMARTSGSPGTTPWSPVSTGARRRSSPGGRSP
jgi:hypothetical protein